MSVDIRMRVVKANWGKKETIFVSKPLPIRQALDLEKEMVYELPDRGEDTLLVKLSEDYGEDFDYANSGGWFIFTHRERIPW